MTKKRKSRKIFKLCFRRKLKGFSCNIKCTGRDFKMKESKKPTDPSSKVLYISALRFFLVSLIFTTIFLLIDMEVVLAVMCGFTITIASPSIRSIVLHQSSKTPNQGVCKD